MVSELSVQEVSEISGALHVPWYMTWKWWIIIALGFLVITGIISWILYKFAKKVKHPQGLTEDKIASFISVARRQSKEGYYSSFFKPEKNAPIKLIWKEKDKPLELMYWGRYMGHMIAEEKFMILLFTNRPFHWALWFVPKIEAIWLPKTDTLKVLKKFDMDEKDISTKEITNIPHDLETFTGGEIMIWAKSFEMEGGLYKPVLINPKTNKPIDTHVVMYSQIEETCVKDFMYQSFNAFADATRKGFEMNTNMMRLKKEKDSGGEITE